MKLYILILITVCFISCKEKPKPHVSTPEEWDKVANDYPADTTINQDIWYNTKYGFCLQTWVKTRRQQTHNSMFSDFNFYIAGDTYAEYNVEIAGSFNYIKTNKIIEYNKAKIFVDSLSVAAVAIRAKQMEKQKSDSIRIQKISDSIKLLKDIQP